LFKEPRLEEIREGSFSMSTGTVKKTKTPAKPKTAVKAASKTKKSDVVATSAPSYAEIAQRAEQYWAERGWQDGYAEQDWLRAEQELVGAAS
jgi:Protein of unknown function (DUF2934)